MKYLALFALAAASTGALAQDPTPEEIKAKQWGKFFFSTRLGSFKVLDGEGVVSFDFKGTVLVTKLKGDAKPEGNIRVEYDKNGRKCYFGQGKMTVSGSWRGIEWFGNDLNGTWTGKGIIRLSGEFDHDLKTGEYWYEGDVNKHNWPASAIMAIVVPKQYVGANPNADVREKKKGG